MRRCFACVGFGASLGGEADMTQRFRWLACGGLVLLAACARGTSNQEEDETSTTGAPGSASSGMGGAAGGMPMQGSGAAGAIGAMATTGGVGGMAMPSCGDGVMDAGEGCDDGNQSNDDSCPDDVTNGGACQPAVCGDGFVWTTDGGTEACDDGDGSNQDDCPDGIGGTCQAATCDDGFLHNLESGDEETVDCGGSCPGCGGGLILSEIVVAPTASEFIEIHNPTATAVMLDQVYLADYGSYYLVATGSGPPGQFDFRVTFPAGSTIAAGGHIVISTQSASEFQAAFGLLPDFDFDASDGGAPAMLGEIDAAAGLSNGDEMLVLFRYNGSSELVTDIDYVVWGNTSEAMDKTGVNVGASTYATETAPASQLAAVAPASGMAVAHCVYSEGAEVEAGGNGYAGHEETGEDHTNTWDVITPTPGAFNNCPVIAAVSKDLATLSYMDRATFATVDDVTVTSTVAFDNVCTIARHPSTGVVYVLLNDSINYLRYLARLNTATGEALSIAQLSELIAAIAFDANGTLYGVVGDGDFLGSDRIGTIDLNTGAFTLALTDPHGDDGETLALNPLDGNIHRFSGTSSPTMFSLALAGPTSTPIAYSGATPAEFAGAFWDPDAAYFVLWDTANNVYTAAPDGTLTDLLIGTTDRMGGAVIP